MWLGTPTLVSVVANVIGHANLAGAIWPQPVEVHRGAQVLWFDPQLRATMDCEGVTLALVEPSTGEWWQDVWSCLDYAVDWVQPFLPDLVRLSLPRRASSARDPRSQDPLSEETILRDHVRDTLAAIADSHFVPWKLHPRRSQFEPDAPSPASRYLSTLRIRQAVCPGTHALDPTAYFGADESYELEVDGAAATVTANSTIGTLRALTTFRQLFYAHSGSGGAYAPQVPVRIHDRPHWRHRGLSVDIARNPFRPSDLLRTLDAMAQCKLNQLHVHATDSQSWPLDIAALPGLARRGAYRPDLVWSAADLATVQRYGAARGVSVYVEIDMPGHTASVAHAFPDLVAAFNELDWSTFAAEPLSGQLKLNSSAVRAFVGELLHDLLPRTRPYASLYHLGGDEVNAVAYLRDETVGSNDPQVLRPLLQRFVDQVVHLAQRYGLRPVVWEEMVLDWNLTLPAGEDAAGPSSTLVQVWRDSGRIEEVLKRGHRVLFGDHHYWYLDCGYGTFLDPYASGQSPPGVPVNTSGGFPSRLRSPYLDYCGPYHNWRHMYMYNPLAHVNGALRHGVEGGEVLLWSEQTDGADLDGKLWPRVAAAAEVLWAGVRQESMLEDAGRRLGEWRERAVTDLGVRMSPVHMTWCLMEGGCNL